jgi:ornithine--oxo-acid transaminase
LDANSHANPRNAITETPAQVFASSRFSPFAQEISELFNSNILLPTNFGAGTVEMAIKLSKKWAYEKKDVRTRKVIALSVKGSFHGRTLVFFR